MTGAAIHTTPEAAEYLTEEGCYILELANLADDPAVSIARARVKPGERTKRHAVAGTVERYVMLQGRGQVSIGTGPATGVGPGTVVRIPAGMEQSITNLGDEDLVFLCICTPRFEWDNYRALE